MLNKHFDVLIEIPKNSSIKYEYDKQLQKIRLDRFLSGANVYPGDYGFIAETLELDGDPIDVLVLLNQSTFPGCIMKVRIIGGLNLIDDGEIDRKIIAVVHNDPEYQNVQNINDVNTHQKNKIHDFFLNYKNLEQKKVVIKNWISLTDSLKIIDECQKRFQTKK